MDNTKRLEQIEELCEHWDDEHCPNLKCDGCIHAQELIYKLVGKLSTPRLICRNCGTEKNIRNSLGELDCACGQQDMTKMSELSLMEECPEELTIIYHICTCKNPTPPKIGAKDKCYVCGKWIKSYLIERDLSTGKKPSVRE